MLLRHAALYRGEAPAPLPRRSRRQRGREPASPHGAEPTRPAPSCLSPPELAPVQRQGLRTVRLWPPSRRLSRRSTPPREEPRAAALPSLAARLTCVGRRSARSRSPRPSRAASAVPTAVPIPFCCCSAATPILLPTQPLRQRTRRLSRARAFYSSAGCRDAPPPPPSPPPPRTSASAPLALPAKCRLCRHPGRGPASG